VFKPAFQGQKQIDIRAQDIAGSGSGWRTLGVWDVVPANQPPEIISVTPAPGSGTTQTVALTVADPDGAANVSTC
jgi:hypothetical protein